MKIDSNSLRAIAPLLILDPLLGVAIVKSFSVSDVLGYSATISLPEGLLIGMMAACFMLITIILVYEACDGFMQLMRKYA